MSVDMRLGAVSEETAGSDGSEPLAVGLSGPRGLCGAGGAATTAAYVGPPSEDPSCRLPEAACSPVALVDVADSGVDHRRVLGAVLLIPNSAGLLALPLASLRSWINEQAWLA